MCSARGQGFENTIFDASYQEESLQKGQSLLLLSNTYTVWTSPYYKYC